MATTTKNLGMTLPDVSDPADVGALNENFKKIDALGGYGLGSIAKEITDAHIATANGQYSIGNVNASSAHVPFQYVLLDAKVYNNRFMVHDFYRWTVDGTQIRRVYSDGWGEYEYVNPPMSLGVEYRTTERWNGKPVYAMLVNIGALPNASSKYVEAGTLPTGIYAVSIHGTAFSGYSAVPVQSNGIYVSVQGEWGTMYVSTTSDYSAYTGYVTVKYTKS